MSKLDLIDKKLLAALDRNARAPLSQLAKQLRISRDVAGYRMKRLEEEGIIKGYDAYIDASKLGYKLYRVYFKLYSISLKQHTELIEMLTTNENTFWVGETDGFVDIVFGVWAKTSASFNIFYRSIMERFRKVIKNEYVHEVITYSYLDRAYLLSNKEERQEFVVGKNTQEPYDEIDISILRQLSRNARASLIEIAQHLKMDSASILYRIRQLEKKKIILGYKVNLNLSLLNRHFYTLKLYLSAFERKKELLTYLRTLSIVTNFTDSIGSWDVEFDVEVESDTEYHSLIADVKEKYDFISEVSFFRAPKTYKIITMPGA